MPLIFRCDVCGLEEDVNYDAPVDSSDYAMNCDRCGQDGCKECIVETDDGPMCDSCASDFEAERIEDEEREERESLE